MKIGKFNTTISSDTEGESYEELYATDEFRMLLPQNPGELQ